MEFENLSLQRNKKILVMGDLFLSQPTLARIDDLGWNKYQEYLYDITSDSKDVADILWFTCKIWYEDIQDEWDFFIQKCIKKDKILQISIGNNKIIEGVGINDNFNEALNFFLSTEGEYIFGNTSSELFLYNATLLDKENNIYTINKDSFKFTKPYYYTLVEYLNKVNWVSKDYDFLHGGTKKAKKYMLKHKYDSRKKKATKPNITIDSIVSSLIAQGQPYDKIWDYPIYMIYDLYYRTIKIDDWKNTMQALHSGCIDTNKNPINWEKINWSSIISIK